MAATSSSFDIELQRADTTWLGLMLAVETDAAGKAAPPALRELLAAQDDAVGIRKRLASDVQEDWSGGVGISYNVAPGVYTRTPGYALSAGASTDLTVTALNNSPSILDAIETFGGYVWVAQLGTGGLSEARVLYSLAGTGALTNSLNMGAGETIDDLIVFPDATGVPRLYASGNDGAGGRIHRLDAAPATWTSTASALFGTNERHKLAKVFWAIDGVGAWRLVAASGVGKISYTRPNSDPMLAASWVEGVRIGSGFRPAGFSAARRHVWAAAQDGLFDLDEQGNAPNLFPAAERMSSALNGYASLYLDGYVYMSLGNGLTRVYVGEGTIEENLGQCAPGWGTQAEHAFRGWSTALCVEQGYVVDAVYNPTTQRSAIFWGRDRRVANIDTPNPLVWYGPEVTSSQNLLVTAMRPLTTGTAGALNLWLAASAYDVAAGVFSGTPTLSQVSLPIAGAPLDDLISGGPHRFTRGDGTGRWQAQSQLELLKLGGGASGGDRASKTIMHQYTLISRGLGAGTKLTLETRADAAPGATTYATSDDATASPSQTITPPTNVLIGNIIGRRLSFVNASTTAIGVLDACRTTYWKVVPSFNVRVLTVAYGDGVGDGANGTDAGLSPDQISADLVALTQLSRTTLRDRQDNRVTVRVEQVVERVETPGAGTYGKTVRARLELSVIG